MESLNSDISDSSSISSCSENYNPSIDITQSTPFQCQYCDKSFPRLSHLKRHEQNHSDKIPFVCNFCQKAFKHKRSRDRHIRIHTGDRRYKCNHCDSAFSRSDHLGIHMRTHDDKKPHRCSQCNRGFSTSAALTSHIQKHKKLTKLSPIDSISNSNNNESKINYETNIINKDDNQCEDENTNVNNTQMDSPKVSMDEKLEDKINNHNNHQVTCGLCGNKCSSLEVHIRESHLHQLLFAGLLQNSIYSASAFANWQQLTSMPPPVIPSGMNNTPSQSPNPIVNESIKQSPSNDNVISMKNGQCNSSNLNQSSKKSKILSSSSSVPSTNGLNCDQVNEEKTLSSYFSLSSLDESKVPFLCNQCSPSPYFPDFESFRVHLKSHLNPSSGTINTLVGLIGQANHQHHHHHGNSPIERSSSTSSSSSSSTLPCPYCESIITSESLESHIINSHLGSMVSSFSCESCKKIFTKSDDLTKHLIDYHSHHLYQCSICREMFDTDVSLQVHFQVKHSNQCKVFKCSICNQLWSNQEDFKVHLKVSHFSPNTNGNLVSSPYHSHSHSHSHTHSHPHSHSHSHNHSHSHPNQHHHLNHNHNLNHNHYSSAFNNLNHHLPSSLVSSTSNLVNPFSMFTPKCQYFKCSYCPDEFHIEYLLEKHIQTVHSSNLNNNNNTKINHKDKKCITTNENDNHNDTSSRSPSPKRNQLSPVISEQLTVNCKPSKTLKRKSSEIDIDIETNNDDSNHNDDQTISNNLNGNQDDENMIKDENESTQIKNKLISSSKLSPTINSTLNKLHSTTIVANKSIKNSIKCVKVTGGGGKGPATKCNICDEICGSISDLAKHKLKYHNVFGKSNSSTLLLSRCLQCFQLIKSENEFITHLIEHNNNSNNKQLTPSTVKSTNSSSKSSSMDELLRTGLTKFPISCIICKQTLLRPLEIGIHAKYHCSSAEMIKSTNSMKLSKSQSVNHCNNDLVQSHENINSSVNCNQFKATIKSDKIVSSSSSPSSSSLSPLLLSSSSSSVSSLATLIPIQDQPLSLTTINQNDPLDTINDHHGNKLKVNLIESYQQSTFTTNEPEIKSLIEIEIINQEKVKLSKCLLCGFKSQSQTELQIHLIEHDYKSATINCPLCKTNHDNPVNLQVHMNSQHSNETIFNCPQCDNKFWFLSELDNHKLDQHSSNDVSNQTNNKNHHNQESIVDNNQSTHEKI
ncbi:zinc finger protein 423-like [Panonychus citri]|uniref:zinc finger protein 423-like n=1 Tax=Panonychus citri TaxID=50023 RepID=UPI00230729D7|nr:zinc finger protein 423-like [Panonychus citri]XP_053213302.1 zinc finger protein 423-like [Panonychus citri]XP_053213303.1 zinc finger protein 423-like [Panonychus citri]